MAVGTGRKFCLDGGMQCQYPAIGHGVARIDGQVHQHRFQLRPVGCQKRRVVVHLHPHLDAGAQRMGQHLAQAAQQGARFDSAGHQLAAAREGEEPDR